MFGSICALHSGTLTRSHNYFFFPGISLGNFPRGSPRVTAYPCDIKVWVRGCRLGGCELGSRELQLSSAARVAKIMADQEKKPFERLPTDVVPRNYKVELKPDLKALTFEGKLEITCEVLEEEK